MTVSDQNNHNVSVLIERGDFRALLTGDREGPQRQTLLAGEAIADVDVLKAAHHGSSNGVASRGCQRDRSRGRERGTQFIWSSTLSGLGLYQLHSRLTLRTHVEGDVVLTVNDVGASLWPRPVVGQSTSHPQTHEPRWRRRNRTRRNLAETAAVHAVRAKHVETPASR